MPQSPESPVKQRVRLVRRRITAAVLATFIAAWLAVAALGKGGATSTAATSGAPGTGTSSQSDDGSGLRPLRATTARYGTPQSGDGSAYGAPERRRTQRRHAAERQRRRQRRLRLEPEAASRAVP